MKYHLANSHVLSLSVKKMLTPKREDAGKPYQRHKLNDFITVKKIGRGKYGDIILVIRLKDNGIVYEKFTLKVISQEEAYEDRRFLLSEFLISQRIEHPFLRSLHRSFKDETNIYFLLEYIQGMELFDVAKEIGRGDRREFY